MHKKKKYRQRKERVHVISECGIVIMCLSSVWFVWVMLCASVMEHSNRWAGLGCWMDFMNPFFSTYPSRLCVHVDQQRRKDVCVLCVKKKLKRNKGVSRRTK